MTGAKHPKTSRLARTPLQANFAELSSGNHSNLMNPRARFTYYVYIYIYKERSQIIHHPGEIKFRTKPLILTPITM